jgi:hypothetical protein
MRRRDDLKLRDALIREDLRGKRDARYRANLAFAFKSTKAILLTIAISTSLGWGWPMPVRVIISRVSTEAGISANSPAVDKHTEPVSRSPLSLIGCESALVQAR